MLPPYMITSRQAKRASVGFSNLAVPVPGRLDVSEVYPAGQPDIRQRFVMLPSGVRIRVVEAGPEQGRPVLLVHGWGGSIYTFRKTISALAASGWRAIAVDLKGHGFSDKPTGAHD